MRKRGRHKPHAAQCPMLVLRGIKNDDIELRERMAVQALAGGWATVDHYQTVLDMANVMLLAGSTDDHRRWAWTYCRETVLPALRKIAERYDRTKKLSVTTGEREVIRAFVTRYREFWLRQPGELYIAACQSLNGHYKAMTATEPKAQEA